MAIADVVGSDSVKEPILPQKVGLLAVGTSPQADSEVVADERLCLNLVKRH